MEKTFRPNQTRNATIFGLALSTTVAVPFVLLLVFGSQGPLLFQFVMAGLFAVISGFIVYATLSGRNMSYTLTNHSFKVNFGLWNVNVPYHSIRNIQRSDVTLLLRIFGGSWPGLHWGLFKAKDIGRVYTYATKVKGDFILITLADDTKIAITPENSESFLAEAEMYRDSFSKAGRDVAKLFTSSQELAFAQIFIVAGVFILLLSYVFWIYPTLPDIIPVHFDINWNPNRWAPKSELFILMGVASIFPLINTVLVLSFGKYGKGFTIFLGVIFTLVMILFFGIILTIQGMV